VAFSQYETSCCEGLEGNATVLVGAGDWHEVKMVDARANARAE